MLNLNVLKSIFYQWHLVLLSTLMSVLSSIGFFLFTSTNIILLVVGLSVTVYTIICIKRETFNENAYSFILLVERLCDYHLSFREKQIGVFLIILNSCYLLWNSLYGLFSLYLISVTIVVGYGYFLPSINICLQRRFTSHS